MNGMDRSQRVSLDEAPKRLPVQVALAVAAGEPLVPAAFDFPAEATERPRVARDAVLRVMTA